MDKIKKLFTAKLYIIKRKNNKTIGRFLINNENAKNIKFIKREYKRRKLLNIIKNNSYLIVIILNVIYYNLSSANKNFVKKSLEKLKNFLEKNNILTIEILLKIEQIERVCNSKF